MFKVNYKRVGGEGGEVEGCVVSLWTFFRLVGGEVM